MNKQIKIFFTALMFFTRIPCPKSVDHSEEYLNKASMYFPLIGWIVGGASAFIFWISIKLFPVSLSLIFSMIASILITGAFHEDGFADVCDGFGGGWTKEKILEIMKDSRVGSYGIIGMILMLGTKFSVLFQINVHLIPVVLIAGHSISRFTSTTLIFTNSYVRENDDSKAKPLSKKMTLPELLIAAVFGLLPLLLLNNYLFILVIIPVFLTRWYFVHYFVKWIGGYTGDCLGAVQQVAEVVFYIFAGLISWKFI
ncbi:MAG: adenosylcobinamide-GDP ribazoletransferase [Ignavibacteriaceae bacterium]|jgi:adenosylcobinamide-GDP ribazoletransferase